MWHKRHVDLLSYTEFIAWLHFCDFSLFWRSRPFVAPNQNVFHETEMQATRTAFSVRKMGNKVIRTNNSLWFQLKLCQTTNIAVIKMKGPWTSSVSIVRNEFPRSLVFTGSVCQTDLLSWFCKQFSTTRTSSSTVGTRPWPGHCLLVSFLVQHDSCCAPVVSWRHQKICYL